MARQSSLRDLNKLHAFVRVAERRSFTKAAQDLRTTPSVLSKHITDLELSLGFSILTRSTRGVALTEAGEGLLKTFLQALTHLDDYVVDARNSQSGPYGSLRIQAASSLAEWILAPMVAAFIEKHPHIRVQLTAEAATETSIDDGYDIIVTSRKPPVPGLVEQSLGVIDHVVCASPNYFASAGKPNEPADLRDHNCLVNSFQAPKEWRFVVDKRDVSVAVKGNASSNSSAVLIKLALNHVGVIRVPRYAIRRQLAEGALKPIFERSSVSHERMNLYCAKTKHIPAKITDFVSFIKETGGLAEIGE